MKKIIIMLIWLLLCILPLYAGIVTQPTVYQENSSVTNTNLNNNIAASINEMNGGLDNENADTTNGFRFYEVKSSLPSAGSQGRMVYLTTDNLLYGDNGASFVSMITESDEIKDADNNTKIQVEETADENIIRMDTETSGEVWNMSNAGERTMTKQPAFLVTADGSQTNIAADASAKDIAWQIEIFDQGSDFATPSFTAPVGGRYLLSLFLRLEAIDNAASVVYLVSLVTSNRTYNYNFASPDIFSIDTNWAFPISIVADMDASDTAKVQITQTNGAAQTDVSSASSFSGCLLM